MYVCLCTGATSDVVRDAVVGGASTCRQVAAACGAGTDCGRCWRTVREIIASHAEAHVRASHAEAHVRASHAEAHVRASHAEAHVRASHAEARVG
jgi:bacterioferritin-associated ferredoxin